MKKTASIMALATISLTALTGCMGWDTVATVGGGTGWYAGDNAPYYWSDWNTPPPPPVVGNGPGSIVSPGWNYRPAPPPTSGNGPGSIPPPSNRPGGPAFAPGNNPGNAPTAPPVPGNRPGNNPGSPSQGGFRGDK